MSLDPTTGRQIRGAEAGTGTAATTQEQRTKQLLEHEELGDRRPSQFLRHLRTLAGTSVPDSLIRTLWLGRLPAQMQVSLATRAEDRLDEVAEQADRILEISGRTTVAAASSVLSKNPGGSGNMEKQIRKLTKQVAALTASLGRLESWRGRSRERSRTGGRGRSKSRDTEDGVCFYHGRFRDKATKCTKPCAYKPENKEGGH